MNAAAPIKKRHLMTWEEEAINPIYYDDNQSIQYLDMICGTRISKEGSMRRVLLLIAVIGLISSAPILAADGDAIVGLWATDPEGEGGQAHIEIYADGDRYNGKIVWLDEPIYPSDDEQGMAGKEKVDRENPDASLRDRKIIGLILMEGFVFDGKGTWQKGTIYDPDNGKTYKSKVKLTNDGVLKVRGFIGVSLIGRTSQWTRVDGD
jgi:uncharacterized protein (DUF2147 family)